MTFRVICRRFTSINGFDRTDRKCIACVCLVSLNASAFPRIGGEVVFSRAVCTYCRILFVDTISVRAVSLLLSVGDRLFGKADGTFSARRKRDTRRNEIHEGLVCVLYCCPLAFGNMK